MLCFIARKKISNACEHGGALTRRVERHLRHCAGCNTFMQQHSRIHQTLASAKQPEGEFPPFLHRRIMHALKSENPPATVWRGLNVRAAGAVVCAVLAVGIGLFLLQPGQNGNAALRSDVERESFQTLETGVEQMEQLVSVAPNVFTQPLEAEMLLLQEDLLTVAQKLDTYLNGAVFAIISPENG